jgi:hypothetical protein
LKEDNFDHVLGSWPSSVQEIVRNLDHKIAELGPIRRYTSKVPDVRYQLVEGEDARPVFARVKRAKSEVLVEIEPVSDPLGRARPREKTRKWKPRSPRSNTELPLTKAPDWYDMLLISQSLVRSMTGPTRAK